MSYPFPDFPNLRTQDLQGAKLCASREELVKSLSLPPDGVVAEIGVMKGDFSVWLMDALKPRTFFAFDWFQAHTLPSIWGLPPSEAFEGRTHPQYYRKRMERFGDSVIMVEGANRDTLPNYANESFDFVYVDANHEYEEVKFDAEAAARMVKPDGIIMFNDYILFDHIANTYYGVAPVVNDMVVNREWRVLGFCLIGNMFCDIAIQRKSYARHP